MLAEQFVQSILHRRLYELFGLRRVKAGPSLRLPHRSSDGAQSARLGMTTQSWGWWLEGRQYFPFDAAVPGKWLVRERAEASDAQDIFRRLRHRSLRAETRDDSCSPFRHRGPPLRAGKNHAPLNRSRRRFGRDDIFLGDVRSVDRHPGGFGGGKQKANADPSLRLPYLRWGPKTLASG